MAAAAKESTVPGTASQVLAFSFEIRGRVQGVYFRKHTKAKADELGICGWVRNSSAGTVVGESEAKNEDVSKQFQTWLSSVGSPRSSITGHSFSKAIKRTPSFSAFKIDRSKSRSVGS